MLVDELLIPAGALVNGDNRSGLLNRARAAATDGPLTWTPMPSVSSFGVPVTAPVPVTVILADPGDEVTSVAACPACPVRAVPVDGPVAAALPRSAPMAKAPMSRAAAAVPAMAERATGVSAMATAELLIRRQSCRFDAAQSCRVPVRAPSAGQPRPGYCPPAPP